MEQPRTFEQLIDAAAAEGRVRRRAQHDNVDLPRWGHRRETRAAWIRYAAAACLLLLLIIPYSLAAQEVQNYHQISPLGFKTGEQILINTLL